MIPPEKKVVEAVKIYIYIRKSGPLRPPPGVVMETHVEFLLGPGMPGVRSMGPDVRL